MYPTNAEDLGKLALRITLGALVLLHGINKLTAGIAPFEAMIGNLGLPEQLAYGVYLGEVLGPILLIIGWYARVGALLIVANMLVAVGLVHLGQLALLKDNGGWQLEIQAMYLVGAIALALLGPGRFALDQR